jgi:hypothetical protein
MLADGGSTVLLAANGQPLLTREAKSGLCNVSVQEHSRQSSRFGPPPDALYGLPIAVSVNEKCEPHFPGY